MRNATGNAYHDSLSFCLLCRFRILAVLLSTYLSLSLSLFAYSLNFLYSPDGMEFATCKEVSTYLQSLVETQSKNQLKSLQSDNKTLEQPRDLPVLNPEPNENLESNRSRSEVFEKAEGDITEAVKDGRGIPTVIGDNEEDDVKKRDDNVENLAARSNVETQLGGNMMTNEKLLEFWSSRNP